ncbi:MAG: response regulator [Armatimonadota bacterium]
MSQIRPETILVVEDEEMVRATICDLLELAGFQAEQAGDGRHALEWLRTHSPPSVILLDLMMPQMTGRDVLDALENDARLSAVPVIVVTGYPVEASGLSYPQIHGFFSKPYSVDKLLDCIADCLAGTPRTLN